MFELLSFVAIIGLIIAVSRLGNKVTLLESKIAKLQQNPAQQPLEIVAEQNSTETTPETKTETDAEPPVWLLLNAELGPEKQHEPQEREPKEPPQKKEASEPRGSKQTFESWIGSRWPVWVGGLALALGGVFLVRYAMDAGLLGPATRLTLAAAFAAILAILGEFLRRGAMPALPKAYDNAMIPGILTAAASVIGLAVIYAAYALYDFIGPTSAFILLALVSVSTLALSLLHGQALAGLGLVSSLVTPLLISTSAGSIIGLFSYLSLIWLASTAAARMRQWQMIAILSNIGLGLWVMTYAFNSGMQNAWAAHLSLLAMIGLSYALWSPKWSRTVALDEKPDQSGRESHMLILSMALSAMVGLLSMMALGLSNTFDSMNVFFIVTTLALANYGLWRENAGLSAVVAGLTAIGGCSLMRIYGFFSSAAAYSRSGSLSNVQISSYILTAAFLIMGMMAVKRHTDKNNGHSFLWIFISNGVPLILTCLCLDVDTDGTLQWNNGLFCIALGAGFILAAEIAFRQHKTLGEAASHLSYLLFTCSAFISFAIAIHILSHGLATTLGITLLGFAAILAMRLRLWATLPWFMVSSICIVLAHIAIDPTLVGPENLGTTPVLNALLPGYGVPALLTILGAWLTRHTKDVRVLNALQGLASLLALLTVAILVRHGLNGGRLTDTAPNLGEQSIYTLLLIGLSGILMTLDTRTPSMAFRYGSMMAGAVSAVSILSLHLFALNPFYTDADIGKWPVLNLLLPGYLLPAMAYAGLAIYARGKRPEPYVKMLTVTGAIMGFAWITLTVRWFWQGSQIGVTRGFLQGETYTYSVVWLMVGVGMLVLGSRFNARSLRLASAGLVLISVLKAFLIDMSNLDGILRPLSFIGLGGVLIGIGLFYQKILAREHKAP